jgi:hypothetical protein
MTSDLISNHPALSSNKEDNMKSVLIGAAVAAAAFAGPSLAQSVRPGNPYADGGYYRGWQNGNAMMPDDAMQWAESHAYRYHGGPKTND